MYLNSSLLLLLIGITKYLSRLDGMKHYHHRVDLQVECGRVVFYHPLYSTSMSMIFLHSCRRRELAALLPINILEF